MSCSEHAQGSHQTMLRVLTTDAIVEIARRVPWFDLFVFRLVCTEFNVAFRTGKLRAQKTPQFAVLATPSRLAWAKAAFPELFESWANVPPLHVVVAAAAANDPFCSFSRGGMLFAHLAGNREYAESAVATAARHGHISLVKILSAQLNCCTNRTCADAAYGGHLDILEYLIKDRSVWWHRYLPLPWDETTLSSAVAGGHVDVLEWLIGHNAPGSRQLDAGLCKAAAKGGQLRMLQALVAHGCKCDDEAICIEAAAAGNVQMLQWAMQQGFPWKMDMLTITAVQGGHLHVLEWLNPPMGTEVPYFLMPPFNIGTSAVNMAAAGGHIPVLTWLVQRGHRLGKEACHYAARNGHLAVLKWLRAQDPPCPWTHKVVEAALANGHNEIAVWATANGCPVT
jgi:hypothetical protein